DRDRGRLLRPRDRDAHPEEGRPGTHRVSARGPGPAPPGRRGRAPARRRRRGKPADAAGRDHRDHGDDGHRAIPGPAGRMTDDQQALIASLEEQERELVFTRFDNADAWRLGSAMVAAAIERELRVTIDIRRHGQQLFHVALPGTTAENDSWIERKV